jgi:hypothetical protein
VLMFRHRQQVLNGERLLVCLRRHRAAVDNLEMGVCECEYQIRR